MITKEHIKQIEILLNKEKIIQFELLQVSFGIACIKFQISDKTNYIAKYSIKKTKKFNAIKSEEKNLNYLNEKFIFFPNVIKSNNNILIMNYFENDKDQPSSTNLDFLEAVIQIHSISNRQFEERQQDKFRQINLLDERYLDAFTEEFFGLIRKNKF